MDLAIVHPMGAERDALAVRRRLVVDARALGWVADVSVMSSAEAVSSGFWDGERVLDLDAAGASCADEQGDKPFDLAEIAPDMP